MRSTERGAMAVVGAIVVLVSFARADGPAMQSASKRQEAKSTDGADARSVSHELDRLGKSRNDRAAIAAIERVLPEVSDPTLRWRLELARQIHLESDHQHEKALANARTLLADLHRTSGQYDALLDHETFNLFNLNRIDEGIQHYDLRIFNAADHPDQRLRLLESKARMLLHHVEPARGIPAWREYRLATEPKSERWGAATAMLALELARNAQHDEAIALREELLKHRCDSQTGGVSSLLVEIARSQQALGQLDRAKRSLDQAEVALQAKPVGDEEDWEIEQLRAQIAALRQLVRSGR